MDPTAERTGNQIERDPVVFRREAFKKTDPASEKDIPQVLLAQLTHNQGIAMIEQNFMRMDRGFQDNLIRELTFILEHSDIIDAYSGLQLNRQHEINPDCTLSDWIDINMNRPAGELPTDFSELYQLYAYHDEVLPMRAHSPSFHDMYQQVPAGQYLEDQAYLSPPGFTAIANATGLAFTLARQRPDLLPRVTSAAVQTIKDLEKWWILGDEADMHTAPTPLHLTRYIADFIAAENPPEVVVKLLTDTLMHKTTQDAQFVNSQLFESTMITSGRRRNALMPVIDWFTDGSISRSPALFADSLHDYWYDEGVTADMVELLAAKPELHTDPVFESDGTVRYFGKQVRLQGLPASDEIHLKELTFGVIAAYDSKETPVAIYNVNPRSFSKIETHVTVTASPTADLLVWSPQAKQEADTDQMDRFLREAPAFIKNFSDQFPQNYSEKMFPIATYYQLWKYLDAKDANGNAKVTEFMERFQTRGLFSFMTGEFGAKNCDEVIDFALNATYKGSQEDTAHPREGITQNLMLDYVNLAFDAKQLAHSMSSDQQHIVAIEQLILQRAKALLVATARIHNKKGYLDEESVREIHASFMAFGLYLRGMIDQTGETAKHIHVPFKSVETFFKFRDPQDPDVRALFNSMFELWFSTYQEKQTDAPYAGKVPELTTAFYEAYEELERDAGVTTADPVLEKVRYRSDIDTDFANGLLPMQGSARVAFVGYGEGRMEIPLIEHINGINPDIRFDSFDIRTPKEIPQNVTFLNVNMRDMGAVKPDTYKRIMLIWSPFNDEIEHEQILKTVMSLAASASEGCVLEIDVPLPIGEHSYEKKLEDYHTEHPEEPEHIIPLIFKSETQDLTKLFSTAKPQFIIPLFEYFGFECVNMPRDPNDLESVIQKIKTDDAFIENDLQEDLNKQSFYRTASGKNRITYKFVLRTKKHFDDLEHQPETMLGVGK
jgi:hypothetical protein